MANHDLSSETFNLSPDDVGHQFFHHRAYTGDDRDNMLQSLTIQNIQKNLSIEIHPCVVHNLIEGRCEASSFQISTCTPDQPPSCDNQDPDIRTYDGSCNNLDRTAMGMKGTRFDRLHRNCYADFVNKPVSPIFGSRTPVLKLVKATNTVPPISLGLTMFSLITFELVNADTHGGTRCPGKTASLGYKSCGVRKADQSFCAKKIGIPSDDPFYQGLDCLNYNKNSFTKGDCTLRESLPSNDRSFWLDLSLIYPNDQVYNSTGHIPSSFCGIPGSFFDDLSTASPNIACIQGLFAKFHNFCVTNALKCQNQFSNVAEKCRQITIGLWQKIVYEDLLPLMFRDMCNLDVCYDSDAEGQATIEFTSVYGRFPHVWIPENLVFYQGGERMEEPVHKVFGMALSEIDTDGLLKGMWEQPFVFAFPISKASHSLFLAGDRPFGHSLTTMDFARGQEAGTCSMLYYLKIAAREQGVYLGSISTFDDLRQIGIFRSDVVRAAESIYSSVNEIPATFGLFETGQNMLGTSMFPIAVNYYMCQEFTRLKAADRLFYEWSLDDDTFVMVKILNMSHLLAIGTDNELVPANPFVVDSPMLDRVAVLEEAQSMSDGFCEGGFVAMFSEPYQEMDRTQFLKMYGDLNTEE
jgi:hypothetical protein